MMNEYITKADIKYQFFDEKLHALHELTIDGNTICFNSFNLKDCKNLLKLKLTWNEKHLDARKMPPSLRKLSLTNKNLVTINELNYLMYLKKLQFYGLSSIHQIPDMPESLTTLNISYTELTVIPLNLVFLKNLTKLEILFNPKLTKIIKLHSNLKILKCHNNALTDIDFIKDLHQLEILDISHNNLKFIENIPGSLKVLKCNNNGIIHISIDMPNLEYINMSHNFLTELDLNSSKLVYANCSHNKIKKVLSLISMDKLTYFYIDNNNIEYFDILPSSLKEFSCAHNKIISIFYFETLVNIFYLNISYNKSFTKLDELPKNIKILICDNCNITGKVNLVNGMLKFSATKNQISVIENIPNSLEYFFCEKNNITTISQLPLNIRNFNCDSKVNIGKMSYFVNSIKVGKNKKLKKILDDNKLLKHNIENSDDENLKMEIMQMLKSNYDNDERYEKTREAMGNIGVN